MELLIGLLIKAISQGVATRVAHTSCQVSDPLKDYLATGKTNKIISQNPITCIASIMNSDQLNELGCHIHITNPDQLNKFKFLNP
ncbi:Chromosomal replication initiator DnaA [Gossypium arboreum]|uniref:Chromosomal replication initiator DnaA n=1 Tax=Gossypium arboreum TaxID=29729 RepID=A0A0B0NZW3_GOSAR|nr:Chromosomal replication initiator DnaA [Gossypium arboreum]